MAHEGRSFSWWAFGGWMKRATLLHVDPIFEIFTRRVWLIWSKSHVATQYEISNAEKEEGSAGGLRSIPNPLCFPSILYSNISTYLPYFQARENIIDNLKTSSYHIFTKHLQMLLNFLNSQGFKQHIEHRTMFVWNGWTWNERPSQILQSVDSMKISISTTAGSLCIAAPGLTTPLILWSRLYRL